MAYIESTTGLFQPTHLFLPTELDTTDDKEIYSIIAALGQSPDLGSRMILHVGGYGGDVQLMVQLINAVKSSKILEKVIVTAPVYSAHAFIAASVPASVEMEIQDNVFFMFHDISSFEHGKLSDITPSVDTNRELLKRILKGLRPKVLTKKEKDEIIKGQDKYIWAEEVKKRLDI